MLRRHARTVSGPKATTQGKGIPWSLALAAAMVACTADGPDVGGALPRCEATPPQRTSAALPDSAWVARLGESLRARFLLPEPVGRKKDTRRARPIRPLVRAGVARSFVREGADGIVPVFAADRPARIELRLPTDLRHPVTLREPTSDVAIEFSLEAAGETAAQAANGLVAYAAVLGQGTELVHRPTEAGTEDFVRFDSAPPREEIAYRVDVAEVAGVRHVGRVVEFLDEHGTPRLRMAAPWVVSERRAGKPAPRPAPLDVRVEGCEVSRDGRAPWGRPPVPPGSRPCRIVLSWAGKGVAYPALVDPSWTVTDEMAANRDDHTATLLQSGLVLVAGGTSLPSAELYDETTSTWAATPDMLAARWLHSATLLSDGRVLLAGGNNWPVTPTPTAEIYDPASGTPWTPTAGAMVVPRDDHTATSLPSGAVLIAGGYDDAGQDLAAAEVFDPSTETFAATASMAEVRWWHRAAALPDGRVLVAGGTKDSIPGYLKSAELYDPSTGQWSSAPDMNEPHGAHVAVTLGNGKVLVAGGDFVQSSELFDPTTNTWSFTSGGLVKLHAGGEGVVLVDGSVLVIAGWDPDTTTRFVEHYSVVDDQFALIPSLTHPRQDFAAVRLPSNDVLVTGGHYGNNTSEVLSMDPVGSACEFPGLCATGFCVDGVCCESECADPCTACSASAKGSGSDGECGPVPEGTDPRDGCVARAPSTCGTIGHCDGAGECAVHAQGTVCAAPSCADGAATTFECDGAGTCVEGTVTCAPYGCDGSGCATTCNGDGQCSDDAFCDVADGTCQPDRGGGEACARDTECASGACVGGHCAEPSTCLDDANWIADDGSLVGCAPYACGPTGCRTSCASALECSGGAVCSESGSCVPAEDGSSDGGCSYAARPRAEPHAGWCWLVAVALGLRRRRRIQTAPETSASKRRAA
ncbi:MAG: hypothetical protein JRI23_34345 [Deltaproteobacteria bacterium]|jgi:hypothetical protein|nr:hypothetical protein [Deltaproteobacteria bacterium]MBW2537379.1 hypothetical protein [Deltaproteobacteria bacterium]